MSFFSLRNGNKKSQRNKQRKINTFLMLMNFLPNKFQLLDAKIHTLVHTFKKPKSKI